MRQALVILAVLVAAAALALTIVTHLEGRDDPDGEAGMDARVELLRSRLNALDKRLEKHDSDVVGLTRRVEELDETAKGFIGMKVPSESDLRKIVDGVLDEKLKNVKWTTKTTVKFEPKSDKDRKFAEVHRAVRGAARLNEEQSNALMALMLEQRDKLNSVYKDAARKKWDQATRDRRLGEAKRAFDGVLKWKFTPDQYRRYSEWRKKIRDRYMRAFLNF
jgi:hypothetical protein